MDKLEQVFVSSTYLDLREAREAVIKTLLEADCIPSGMELFPASDDDRWTLIKRVIDQCDYYIVIIGGRYGSVDETTGLSYTEKEFDYADEVGKPIMGFVHAAPEELPLKASEKTTEAHERLQGFRAKVEERMCKPWASPSELAGNVAVSLFQIRKTHPAVGWVRGDEAMTADTRAEMAELRERVAELEGELREVAAVHRGDTTDLAQGDDKYSLFVSVEYNDEDKAGNFRLKGLELTTTWDELFADVAPTLLDEATETQLKEVARVHVARVTHRALVDREVAASFSPRRDLTIPAFFFEDVRVQLYALGLIERGTKRRGVNDQNVYWRLTQNGESHLMKLRAIRKPKPTAAKKKAGQDMA